MKHWLVRYLCSRGEAWDIFIAEDIHAAWVLAKDRFGDAAYSVEPWADNS